MKAEIEEKLKIELDKYCREIESLIDSVEKITVTPNKSKRSKHPYLQAGAIYN